MVRLKSARASKTETQRARPDKRTVNLPRALKPKDKKEEPPERGGEFASTVLQSVSGHGLKRLRLASGHFGGPQARESLRRACQ